MISVIVPTCNRNDLLTKCLDLLSPSKQTINEVFEVIVTDDSKDNNAMELIVENCSWVKWVEGPKRGPAANRNNGARNAEGEWLVFIDDDCLPNSNILEEYILGIKQNSNSLAFEGAILPDNWELLKKDLSECPVNTSGNCFWSANVCVNSKVFKGIGGFDESYLLAAQEDQQIKLDIENFTKKPITFLKDCIVVHPVRFSTIWKQLQKIPNASKNYSAYAVKNKEKLGFTSNVSFCFIEYKFHLKNMIRLIKGGKAKSIIVSFAWLCYGIPLNLFYFIKNK